LLQYLPNVLSIPNCAKEWAWFRPEPNQCRYDDKIIEGPVPKEAYDGPGPSLVLAWLFRQRVLGRFERDHHAFHEDAKPGDLTGGHQRFSPSSSALIIARSSALSRSRRSPPTLTSADSPPRSCTLHTNALSERNASQEPVTTTGPSSNGQELSGLSGFGQRTGGAISYGCFVMTYGVITVVNGKSVKPSETVVMIVSVPVIVFPFRDPLNVNC